MKTAAEDLVFLKLKKKKKATAILPQEEKMKASLDKITNVHHFLIKWTFSPLVILKAMLINRS